MNFGTRLRRTRRAQSLEQQFLRIILETRPGCDQAVSLRLTTDEEAACRHAVRLSVLFESLSARSMLKKFEEEDVWSSSNIFSLCSTTPLGQCYKRGLQLIRKARRKSKAYTKLRAKSRSWF
ncbi:uncharacterized protein LOC122577275 [Bombus pyrosoma]|uniref:uncharacterized protein LOC122577275 n=1 Tax=Bombus pyrosoma TaxID=396416 RepID=UPI001CB8E09A|nr:uncharacterized protein LOC122577275 [Bombus pyrosoma]